MSYVVSLKISTGVQSHYIRNNKSNGQKNIRCFPRCALTGHRVAGFCGSGIKASVSVSAANTASKSRPVKKQSKKDAKEEESNGTVGEGKTSDVPSDQKFDFDDLVVVAEFLMWDPDHKPSESQIKTGTFYEADPVLALVKTRGNSLAPLFRANSPEDAEGDVSNGKSSLAPDKEEKSFVIEPTCWHYGWKSHKHSNGTTHFLRVYAFQRVRDESGENYLKCLAYDDTSRFTISSSKRYQRRSDGNMRDISGAPIAKRRNIASEKKQERAKKAPGKKEDKKKGKRPATSTKSDAKRAKKN